MGLSWCTLRLFPLSGPLIPLWHVRSTKWGFNYSRLPLLASLRMIKLIWYYTTLCWSIRIGAFVWQRVFVRSVGGSLCSLRPFPLFILRIVACPICCFVISWSHCVSSAFIGLISLFVFALARKLIVTARLWPIFESGLNWDFTDPTHPA